MSFLFWHVILPRLINEVHIEKKISMIIIPL
jgi:hypothetical protein